jgi:hypothetical protein
LTDHLKPNKTTERYAHVLVHRQRQALEGLGALTVLHQPPTPAATSKKKKAT